MFNVPVGLALHGRELVMAGWLLTLAGVAGLIIGLASLEGWVILGGAISLALGIALFIWRARKELPAYTKLK